MVEHLEGQILMALVLGRSCQAFWKASRLGCSLVYVKECNWVVTRHGFGHECMNIVVVSCS